MRSAKKKLVFWRWVPRTSLFVFLWVLARRFCLHCSGIDVSSILSARTTEEMDFEGHRKDVDSDRGIEKLTKRAFATIPNLSSPLSNLNRPPRVWLLIAQDAVAPIAANP